MGDLRQQLEDLIRTERSAFKRQLYQNLLDKLGPEEPATPGFRNLEELRHALDAQRRAQEAAKPKPVDPIQRINDIEDELDICRGVKPTPAGYRVDPGKVKALMTELKQLRAKHG